MTAPFATGKITDSVNLTGMLFPCKDGQPALLSAPDSKFNFRYLPCFSDEEKLTALMAQAEVLFDSIKQIEDGKAFLNSIYYENIANDIRVIINPYYLPNGHVRFVQVEYASSLMTQ